MKFSSWLRGGEALERGDSSPLSKLDKRRQSGAKDAAVYKGLGDRGRLVVPAAGLAAIAFAASGCHTDMWRQPRHDPLDESEFFADGQVNRPLVPGTIARDHLREDDAFFTGFKNGKLMADLPMPLTMDLLKRGQERFNIYCTPCHGRLGDGDGMISRRGFKLLKPVGNYHTDRLRKMPLGHFYDVITNGYGAMFSYASRVEPQDRWAIAAYIRALQLSQHADPADADPVALEKSTHPQPAAGEGATPGQNE